MWTGTGPQRAHYSYPPTPPASQDIDLRQCGTVKSADDLTNRPFSFTGVQQKPSRAIPRTRPALL